MKKNIAAILLALITVCAVTQAQISVVVNPQNPISDITMAELRKIYLGKVETWKAGQPIQLTMRANADKTLDGFYSQVIQQPEPKYASYWTARRLAGNGTGPKSFESGNATIEFIISNPNAIGVIRSSDVTSAVKALTIDGKKPLESGYALN